MIQVKKKLCKGYSKTSGHGCGNMVYLFKYGLCKSCFIKWATTTPEGKELIQKSTIKAKKQVLSDEKKETVEKKRDLMSVDEYRSKVIQPIINEIARLIDNGQPCIATGNFGKLSGGHYHAVGSNRTLALNLHNIHNQSYHSNSWKGGDNIRYKEGLVRIYGQGYADYVERLKSIPAIHLSKSDLYEIKRIASEIRHDLKQSGKTYTSNERIELREYINQKIGIYTNN